MKHPQRGVSLMGILFVSIILILGGIFMAQVVPTMLEFQAIRKAANTASAGGTVGEVRTMFDKAAQINDIRSIAGKDLVVTRENDRTIVAYAYNREIPLVGPAFLVIKYKGNTQ